MNIELPDNIQDEKGYLGHTFSKLEALCDIQILALRDIELSVRKLALRWGWKQTRVFEFLQKNEHQTEQKANKSTTENQGVMPKIRTKGEHQTEQNVRILEKEKPTPKDNNISNPLLKEKEINKEKVKKEIDFSIVADNMRPVVDIWLSYKKEKQQSYKPIGFKTFYKRLCELSGSNPNIAMQIVEQSMANNYSGIFPLKQENYANNRTTGNNNGQQITTAQEREDWLISRISRKYKGVLDE